MQVHSMLKYPVRSLLLYTQPRTQAVLMDMVFLCFAKGSKADKGMVR